MADACCALPCANVSMTHHEIPFKCVRGLVSVRKRASDSVELVIVDVSGVLSLAEGGGTVWCAQKHYLGKSE